MKYDRPVKMPIEAFDAFVGGEDPAVTSRLAHDTAQALLHRVRETEDPEVVTRTVTFARANGLEDLATLWSGASSESLPGALWRLYLIHEAVAQDPSGAAYIYRRGAAIDVSASHMVAGAREPAGPNEIKSLIEAILRGAFTGDFTDALHRATAFCAVMSLGCMTIASDDERSDPERAARATSRGSRYLEFSKDLDAAARLSLRGRLE